MLLPPVVILADEFWPMAVLKPLVVRFGDFVNQLQHYIVIATNMLLPIAILQVPGVAGNHTNYDLVGCISI